MEQGVKRTQRDYSLAFKLSVVDQVEKGELTYQQVRCSMTDGYDCYQNALAERINGILKSELLLSGPEDLKQARKMVEEAVLIYNMERPHMALKNKTPDAVHRAF